mgnify:CR=1 FL=1
MRPVRIAARAAVRIRSRLGGIALQPAEDVVVVTLLAPQKSGECLPLDQLCVFAQVRADPLRVEFVRFFLPAREYSLEFRAKILDRKSVV